jgi:hypothetical protein
VGVAVGGRGGGEICRTRGRKDRKQNFARNPLMKQSLSPSRCTTCELNSSESTEQMQQLITGLLFVV